MPEDLSYETANGRYIGHIYERKHTCDINCIECLRLWCIMRQLASAIIGVETPPEALLTWVVNASVAVLAGVKMVYDGLMGEIERSCSLKLRYYSEFFFYCFP